MDAIYEAGGRLSCVVTLADERARSKSGRVYVDGFCRERGIALTKVANINDVDAVTAIEAADLDFLFVIGWSQIARAPLLRATRRGVLGMHPTLLPQGRGRAAIPWAILLGLSQTGVTLFQLDEGVDSGPVLARERVPIERDETATTLYRKVEEAHRRLILGNWPSLSSGALAPVPQVESEASVWAGRQPGDGRLDPTMTIEHADRLVRAVTRPYPGAFIDLDRCRLRVWAARITHSAPASANEESGPILAFHGGWLIVTDSTWEMAD
ncbi:MAG: formyltransferase family protein [Gammaproteobacteria bacterium]